MACSGNYVDTKTVGKLENFNGSPAKWGEWSFTARAWLGLLDIGQGAVDAKMDTAEENMYESVDNASLNEDSQAASTVVYNVFARVCGGKALSIIRRVQRGNGLE